MQDTVCVLYDVYELSVECVELGVQSRALFDARDWGLRFTEMRHCSAWLSDAMMMPICVGSAMGHAISVTTDRLSPPPPARRCLWVCVRKLMV